MNYTKEGQSKGGHTQSQKVYFCSECSGIGKGQRMVSDHLNGCKGMGRKLKKATEDHAHRLEEAKANSELYYKQQIEKDLKRDYNRARADIMSSIETMRNIFGSDYKVSLQQYYRDLF